MKNSTNFLKNVGGRITIGIDSAIFVQVFIFSMQFSTALVAHSFSEPPEWVPYLALGIFMVFSPLEFLADEQLAAFWVRPSRCRGLLRPKGDDQRPLEPHRHPPRRQHVLLLLGAHPHERNVVVFNDIYCCLCRDILPAGYPGARTFTWPKSTAASGRSTSRRRQKYIPWDLGTDEIRCNIARLVVPLL